MIAVSLISIMLLAIYGTKVKAQRDFNQKYHSAATSSTIPRAAFERGGIKKNMAPKLIRKLMKYYAKQGYLERAEALCRFNIGNEFFRFQHRGYLVEILQKTGDTIALTLLLQNIINFPVKIPSKKVEDYKEQAGLLLEKITATQLEYGSGTWGSKLVGSGVEVLVGMDSYQQCF